MAVKRHFWLWGLAAAALALYVAAGDCCFRRHASVSVPAAAEQALPEIYFYDKSRRVTLADFSGQVLLVNLWATWCAPCIAELGALDRLQQRFPPAKFRVVAISLDRSSPAAVADFLQARGVKSLEAYWDRDRQVPLKWRYDGLPTSYLLDRTGRVVRRYDGAYDWDAGPLAEEIGALLP